MAVCKMRLVNLVTRKENFDKAVDKYVEKYNIHLENSLNILKRNESIVSLDYDDEYQETKDIIKNLLAISDIDIESEKEEGYYEFEKAKGLMFDINDQISSLISLKQELDSKITSDSIILQQLEPMISTDIDLKRLIEFKFIKFRFGRLPIETFKTLSTYLDDLESVFIQTAVVDGYVCGFYFMPNEFEEKVDGVFTSLCFERIRFTDRVSGTPKKTYKMIEDELHSLEQQHTNCETKIKNIILEHKGDIIKSYYSVLRYEKNSTIRRFSSRSDNACYIAAWLEESDATRLEKELEKDNEMITVLEKPEDVTSVKPPTVLKNNKLFKPFESFVNMYGLPSYNEFDPTPLLAITYILFFGMMFGDLGQGLVLSLVGFLLYRKSKADLWAILSIVGISSAAFGLIYGSFFGNETLLEHIRLIEPGRDVNTVLIGAVAFGTVIISISMIVNICNAIKNKKIGEIFFGQNGLAGFIFYWAAIILCLSSVINTGSKTPIFIMIILLGIPLLLILFQEPLKHLLEGRKKWLPTDGVEYLEAFFELFEILLSYITNTVSFVRIGAFAINHVGMMSVVFILADMAGKGGNIAVYVFGNILVMGLEGLIVGIQVLRLEFYEMFSRFYAGNGVEFKNLNSLIKK